MKITSVSAAGHDTNTPGGRPWWRRARAGLTAAAVATLLVAAQLALGAQPAAAAPATISALTYVQGRSGPDSLDKSVFLECPANQVIVGGSPILSTNTGVFARISGMRTGLLGDHGFLVVQAEEEDVNSVGNWTLFLTAVCAQRPPGYEVVPGETPFTSASKNLTVTCPAGKQLLAGFGVVQTDNRNVILDDVQPSMSLNSVTINAFEDETGFAGNWNIFATAACANPVAGQKLRFLSSEFNSASKPYTVVFCATGERAISLGGTIDSGFGQVEWVGSFVDSNSAGFLAFEDQTGFSGNWSQTAYVMCVT
jgi:hypothetical protein